MKCKVLNKKELKSTEHTPAIHTAVLQLYLVEMTSAISSISVAVVKDPACCLLWLLKVLVVSCYHADGTQLMSCVKDADSLYSSFTNSHSNLVGRYICFKG
jgi:hypothetical protein